MTKEPATTSTEQDAKIKDVEVSKDVLEIIEKYNSTNGELIAILDEIQTKYGYLPEPVLRTISNKTGSSLVDIFGVATFYHSFKLKPVGKHLICACLGTACHVRGGQSIVEEFERQLGIKAGETTQDKEFTLETVNCLGACALGPVVVIDGYYFSKVRKSRVKHLLDDTRKGLDNIDLTGDARIFPIEARCPRCNHTLMDKELTLDGYPSIKVTLSFNGKQGWLRLSSLYGSYNFLSEHDIPIATATKFYCPYCHENLNGYSECPICGATMVSLIVVGGGMVYICSRRGCKNHLLDLV